MNAGMVLPGAVVVFLAAANFAIRVPGVRFAAVWIVALAIVCALVLRRRRVDPVIIGILLGGIALDVLYASYTSWSERNPDAHAHVRYVRYLLDHHALPSAAECSECHHPPLYYLVAATVLAAGSRALDSGVLLQMLSLSLFATFLVSAAVLVQRALRGRIERAVAMTLIACWPYGVIQSVRVNNDALVCAIAGLVLLSLFHWLEKGRPRDLWTACALVLLGLCTKASALSLLAIVCAVAGHGMWRSRSRRRAWGPLAALLIVCALLGVVRRSDVLGTANRTSPAEVTPRTGRFYLTFEPRDFVDRPFVVARRWQTGEPTYWNQFLKSSLFGVRNALLFSFRREPEPSPGLARAMNATVLGLTALTVLGVARAPRRYSSLRRFCLIAIAGFLAAAVAFHLLVPYSFHADFRFVLPIVVPLSIAFALGGLALRPIAAVAFAAMSVTAFVPSTWSTPPERAASALPGAR